MAGTFAPGRGTGSGTRAASNAPAAPERTRELSPLILVANPRRASPTGGSCLGLSAEGTLGSAPASSSGGEATAPIRSLRGHDHLHTRQRTAERRNACTSASELCWSSFSSSPCSSGSSKEGASCSGSEEGRVRCARQARPSSFVPRPAAAGGDLQGLPRRRPAGALQNSGSPCRRSRRRGARAAVARCEDELITITQAHVLRRGHLDDLAAGRAPAFAHERAFVGVRAPQGVVDVVVDNPPPLAVRLSVSTTSPFLPSRPRRGSPHSRSRLRGLSPEVADSSPVAPVSICKGDLQRVLSYC
jgi:hypothetical protein